MSSGAPRAEFFPPTTRSVPLQSLITSPRWSLPTCPPYLTRWHGRECERRDRQIARRVCPQLWGAPDKRKGFPCHAMPCAKATCRELHLTDEHIWAMASFSRTEPAAHFPSWSRATAKPGAPSVWTDFPRALLLGRAGDFLVFSSLSLSGNLSSMHLYMKSKLA